MTSLRLVAALAATATASTIATAQVTVVQYGPANYHPTLTTSHTVAHNRTATSTAGSAVMPFSSTVQLSPTADYTGPVYFGGAQWTNDQGVNRNFSRNQVRFEPTGSFANSMPTFSQVTTSTTFTTGTGTFAGLLVFPQSSFINGGNTGTVALDSLSATIVGQSTSGANTQLRWLVQTGSRYYVSSVQDTWAPTSPTSTGNLTRTLASSDLATTTWAPYDPTTLNFNQAGATFSALDVSSLTGVGLYFEVDSFSLPQAGTGQILYFALRQFNAVGVVVPEPGTYAAIVGALCLVTVGVLRRRRS